MTHGPSVAVFIAQIVALLLAGRLAGELFQRIGQPAVTGQIIAGVLLGPSALGLLVPSVWHSLFPAAPEQRAMLDAVAQLGVLLLLMMTGMETDLAAFREARRPAIYVSLSGIVVPFICGCVLGALLPDSMLPSPARRLLTTLFLGTALSISSVKIVALVIRDLGFLRRNVGQVIVAASILDDTVGWVIVSITFGLALHGTIDAPAVARSLIGTAVFLTLSFTFGRRLVFRLVRWSNDTLTSELAPVTMILVITALFALLTDALGVHFVLGAFVAGILIGQSPILTRQLAAQLRGLIIALFMPVFFALAGLSVDIAALGQPRFLWLTAGLIALASVGKFMGAFLGGRLGGLNYAESFAVGCGMNARGSTEVIVASIGLQVAALSRDLYTAIVAMAVVTTTAMPPMLRFAFRRLPLSRDERGRLEREEFEARAFWPQVERLLVAVDSSSSGHFAARIAGLLAGARGTPTTVLHLDEIHEGDGLPAADRALHSTAVVKAAAAIGGSAEDAQPAAEVDVTGRTEAPDGAQAAIDSEAHKGYGLLLIGREPAAVGTSFSTEISSHAGSFPGAFAIAVARGRQQTQPDAGPLNVLVTVSGTRTARHGAELAIVLAHASRGSVSALHVDSLATGPAALWRERLGSALAPRASAAAAIGEIQELGAHYGIEVRGRIDSGGSVADALRHELRAGSYDLLVMGVSLRPGDKLFLGDLAAQMLREAQCSLLFVCADAPTAKQSAR